MRKFILEFLLYSSFVCVLYVISYSNHNLDQYYQVQHLRRFFLNPENSTHNFEQIITINEYWKWLEESFVINLVDDKWYNGQTINDSQGYLKDNVNRLIGWATMRQLRVKSDTCRIKSKIQGLISNCYDEYSGSTEESSSFFPGWTTNETSQNYSSSINQAFIYKTSEQLDTYVYLGEFATYRSGGYVYEFRDSLSQMSNDLSQLHQLGWIDEQTRAIIIQMNLYNPSTSIFTSSIIIIEILPSSGIYPSARFEPLDFNVFKSIFQIICAFIYLTFIIYFMIVEFYSLIRLKKLYFHQIWSYFELGIIICSWASVGIHVWRTTEVARIARIFRETNGNTYVNFQLIAYLRTAQMLFQMLLLKFNTSEIVDAAPVLGPLYFTLFILFVVFICINMFVSIINDNFRHVRADVHKVDHHDQVLFINFLKNIKRWCGNDNTVNVITINEKTHSITVAEMVVPIQRLSNKLDQLMTYVNRHYEDNQ